MHIKEAFRQHMTFSFEVYPPKNDQPLEPLLETLNHLYDFKPDFVSCTYGAGGTNRGRNIEIVRSILNSERCEALLHFTCIGNSRQDVKEILSEYTQAGVSNVLALRGDLPVGWEGTRGDFHHADELITYLKELYPDLCIAAAAYPEKHIQAPAFAADIAYLRSKQSCGADFLMTQLCHDVSAYERFFERIRKAGVTLPVVVGLMPVLTKDPTIRMALSNGCAIPRELSAIIGKYGDDPVSFKKAGKDYTVEQIFKFMNAGIDGIHFYTLNRYQDVSDIITMSGIRSNL